MAVFETVQNGEMQDYHLRVREEECIKLQEANSSRVDSNGTSVDFSEYGCGYFWDQVMCWPPADPATLNVQPCPYYIAGFRTKNFAYKYCTSNGSWYDWTNYSECFTSGEATILVPHEINETLHWKYIPIVRNLADVGYGLSLVTLIAAFLILASFKKLRCPRNMLHLHLFVSFIMRAFMGFLKSSLFEQSVGLPSNFGTRDGLNYFVENKVNWECKALTSLWQYFIMANYSWILMEGLYIHNLIMWALSADSSSIIVYVIFGWGLPLIFIPMWAVARIVLDNHLCWTVNTNSAVFYLIQVPTTTSILINFALFVNIVRLLMGKVRTSILEERQRYWRLAKSTLWLVALFGVPYFAFLGLSFGDEKAEIVWLMCDQLFSSFQGFLVSLLYCYLNGEVQDEIKNKWRRMTYNDRVVDNALPASSCASWSSSYTAPRSPWSLDLLCSLCKNQFKSKQSAKIRSSQRSGTVDCIVCETCPKFHEEVKLSPNSECELRNCPEVELKLLNCRQNFEA